MLRLLLGLLLVLFALLLLQNLAMVELNFLLWSVSLPRVILLLLVFLLGLAVGYGWAKWGRVIKRH
ncbi:lipopolysaccharide assembly protein LapA domain-containing protein [Dasania sp. GY-MA-18]|uniref:Lipopolysaccharide assembly protein LapA domain-containing protein n=1 Tax=Dasania phycosphaerae TaxID=2950436 RepID=A0A9J6RLT8_9GAMM|nr:MULTISPECIES: lipopolysaccharide assembly protein LapA domain-containing protein [Dasania]MCR8922915.1 lipopolysaccharide assembly protein LapA domain-containing protein [Dasania sp. GY-MA-18]MCZ0865346.1 lipopolysaccharide assembly protein LapA domain-containing protein [Dasania phycosphaerae]MCZ0869071.1 lipopolysaccharide assembly protein LapA domain-containing protein [Dasania phycosphaerae]